MGTGRIDGIATALPPPDTVGDWAARRDLIRAVRKILQSSETLLYSDNCRFRYAVDPATRSAVIKLVNTETQETLYEWPAEFVLEALKLARARRRTTR